MRTARSCYGAYSPLVYFGPVLAKRLRFAFEVPGVLPVFAWSEGSVPGHAFRPILAGLEKRTTSLDQPKTDSICDAQQLRHRSTLYRQLTQILTHN